MNYLFFVLIGLLAGSIGALIGAGGGFIAVPLLFLGMKMPPQTVVGLSLTMIFFNALSGSITFWRQRRIDLSSGWKFALATFPGVILGSQVIEFFSERTFGNIFGLLLILLAGYMYFQAGSLTKPQKAPKIQIQNDVDNILAEHGTAPKKGAGWVERVFIDFEYKKYYYQFNEYLGIGFSFVIGFLSGVLGIGGGIISVPVLVTILKFPPHVATATSLFMVTWSAIFGSITHFVLGHFPWSEAFFLSAGGIAGAQLGARASARLRGITLIRIFSIVLTAVGIRMIMGL